MILINKNNKITLQILRAELNLTMQLHQNFNPEYTITFGNQLRKGSSNLRHRDVFEFYSADSNKIIFKLLSKGVLLGQAQIFLVSNKNYCPIVSKAKNKMNLGNLYYNIGFCQINKQIFKHIKNAQSEHYQRKSRSKNIRQKSYQLKRNKDESNKQINKKYENNEYDKISKQALKSKGKLDSVQNTQQLFSNYFLKKSKKNSQLEKPVNEQIDNKQLSFKENCIQKQLECIISFNQEILQRSALVKEKRKAIHAKLSEIKIQIEEISNTNLQGETQQQQLSELQVYNYQIQKQKISHELQKLSQYYQFLKQQICKLKLC